MSLVGKDRAKQLDKITTGMGPNRRPSSSLLEELDPTVDGKRGVQAG
jgi:hypothetical protein